MDKEQARFILRSFRPDGADVNDADFAEALALAMENRELGEWLAGERAFDAAFAKALTAVDLPETLREDILGCLAGERGDFPQAEDHRDAALIGALALGLSVGAAVMMRRRSTPIGGRSRRLHRSRLRRRLRPPAPGASPPRSRTRPHRPRRVTS